MFFFKATKNVGNRFFKIEAEAWKCLGTEKSGLKLTNC